ncbi:MFS transporter [Nocardia fluminea]|uniref:MFS transporter n=1 Tax=Nocardia fluminea TaxID=134984 RepID=UPI0033CB832B
MTIADLPRTADESSHQRRITVALFAAGLATFGMLFSAQALLPSLSAAFTATPAQAGLAVSLTIGTLAVAVVPVSALSGRWGRTRVMTASVLSAAVIGLLLPLSPSLEMFLAGRTAQGLALAGVPAVAMTYLAEESAPDRLGTAMGMYIAGTSLGGLGGRLIPGFLVEVCSWRWAAAAGSVAAALCAIWFVRMLPPARRFTVRPTGLRAVAGDLVIALRERVLYALFGVAFVLMGGFVALYNFLGFRLLAAPFELTPVVANSVFVLYLAGTATSAFAGRCADRFGRVAVLATAVATMGAGVLITIPDRLVTVAIGMVLCTAGFFGAHTVAGVWVGSAARDNRAAAASLYLLAYYLGGALGGGLSGLAFGRYGWPGVVCCVAGLTVLAAVLTAYLGRTTTRIAASPAMR